MHTPRNESPYDSYGRQNLLLRDFLAMDRTSLANERTLLAYVRTALALVVVGGTLLHFFESVALEVVGVAFILIGVCTTVVGLQRFIRMHRILKQMKHGSSQKSEQSPPVEPSKPTATTEESIGVKTAVPVPDDSR